VLIIGYGIYKAKAKTSEEYFLGGRSMIWPVVGISLFAANISSSTLVGLAGDAFLVANVLVDTAAGLYVGLLILKIIFPDVAPTYIIITLAVLAAAYTIPGGLSSVVHTEVVQAVILILGSCLLTYYAFDAGGGWSSIKAQLGDMMDKGAVSFGERAENGKYIPQTVDEVLKLSRPANDDFMPLRGLLFGAPILGFYFWATNQFMVQRVLGAKDVNHGRWGALFAGFLKLPVLFIMVLPGLIAIVLFNDLDLTFLNYTVDVGDGVMAPCPDLATCPNMTYPVLLFKLLPHGILGLVLAGLLAAMMSSVSATLNSASTLVTMDFVKQLRPNLTSQQLVRVGQIATIVLVVLAALWAPQIEKLGSLFKYLQLVIAYICPPAVAVFMLGLFWKRMNGHGAFAGLMTGFVTAVAFLILQNTEGIASDSMLGSINGLHFLDKAIVLLVVAAVVQIVVSLATAPQKMDQIGNYIYTKEFFDKDTASIKDLPWYQNYRVLSGILLLATVILIYIWW